MSANGSYNSSVHETNGTTSNYSGNMYSSSIDFALTYNILDDNFIPYVSANVLDFSSDQFPCFISYQLSVGTTFK